MKVTRVYEETLKAFKDKFRYIINRGGTRSSKTFSALQVFHTIAQLSNKKRIITIVSHSLPHLEGGAIRDFDNILRDEGIEPESVRTKRPYIYTINNTTIEFIGFDKPGKALGAARDILFINEANKMPFDICHQLMTRTTECIFIDFNPANDFWIDEHGYTEKNDAIVIESTFRDNIENLTSGQLDDLKEAKRKAEKEKALGVEGYWSNWWKVYGEGKKGLIQGVIFPLVTWIDKFPEDVERVFYGIDFGYTNDPTAIVKIGKRKYGKELFLQNMYYKPVPNAMQLEPIVREILGEDGHAWADSADPGMIADLRNMGLKVYAAKKFPGCIKYRVDILNRHDLHIVKDQHFKKEQEKYTFKEVNGIILSDPDPDSKFCHLWDAAGYAAQHELR